MRTLRRVLLIEDDPTAVDLMVEAFDDELPDTIVAVAKSLAEARALDPGSFDVVVSDLCVRDGSGIELLGTDEPGFPVVIMAKRGDERAAVEAIKAGALDYVVKTPRTLRSMPHIALGAAREWRQVEARRVAEAQLRHADRLAVVGRLAAGVFHEIGTPLNVIRMQSQLLELDAAGAADIAPLLVEQCDRIATLVRDTLDFARVRPAGSLRASVPEVVDKAVRLLAAHTRRAGVSVRVDVAPVEAKIDGQALLQVVLNLLTNAIQAMDAGGTLQIGASAEDDQVVLSVQDTGQGIDPANLPLLFTPFFTTKEAGHGTGLGLAVCRDLVAAADGTVDAAHAPGGGAVFTVRLPRVPTSA